MSKKSAITSTLIVMGIFIFAWASKDSQPRMMASVKQEHITVATKKLNILGNTSRSALAHTMKLSGPIQIELKKDKNQEIIMGEPFALSLQVKVSQPMEKVTVQWSLPAEVELVSGAYATTLFDLDPDQPQVVSVSVVSHSQKNQQIHAVAHAELGDIKFSDVTQYNTVLQNKIRKSKEELLQRSRTYADERQKAYY